MSLFGANTQLLVIDLPPLFEGGLRDQDPLEMRDAFYEDANGDLPGLPSTPTKETHDAPALA